MLYHSMKKEYLHYIDVAKGILILLVLFHHLPQVMDNYFIYDIEVLNNIQSKSFLYVSFFMPAFFVITGRCSNFSKPFRHFFWGNVKTLLIPAFCLGVFSNWINLASIGDHNLINYCKLGFRTFGIYGGPYWFISALFVAKILYWIVSNFFKNKVVITAFVFLCFVFSVFLNYFFQEFDFWHIPHAFGLLCYLHIGVVLRSYSFKRCGVFFCIISSIMLSIVVEFFFGGVPYITQNFHVNFIQMPVFLFLATTGSIALIGVSALIQENRVLEYFGKKSLIFYCLHISIIRLLCKIFSSFLSTDFHICFVFIGIYVLTILLCSLFSYCFSLKYLKWSIGKF